MSRRGNPFQIGTLAEGAAFADRAAEQTGEHTPSEVEQAIERAPAGFAQSRPRIEQAERPPRIWSGRADSDIARSGGAPTPGSRRRNVDDSLESGVDGLQARVRYAPSNSARASVSRASVKMSSLMLTVGRGSANATLPNSLRSILCRLS